MGAVCKTDWRKPRVGSNPTWASNTIVKDRDTSKTMNFSKFYRFESYCEKSYGEMVNTNVKKELFLIFLVLIWAGGRDGQCGGLKILRCAFESHPAHIIQIKCLF